MATIRPSPTTTSQAAITITTIAKTCPSELPSMRLKATSARLPALSISSRQSRITSGLRRSSTPAAPVANRSAERTTYQEASISRRRPPGRAGGLPRRPVPAPVPPPHRRCRLCAPGQRDEVDDQRQDGVEGVAQCDDRDRAPERPDCAGEEGDSLHQVRPGRLSVVGRRQRLVLGEELAHPDRSHPDEAPDLGSCFVS